MPTLENWSLIDTDDPYTAPELRKVRLHGIVHDHPRFNDGDEVMTSSIVGATGDTIMTSSGSLYTLGKVNPDYEEKYPNARERLFQSMRGAK